MIPHTALPSGLLTAATAQAGWTAPFAGVTLAHYLFVACALFIIGLVGFLTRRNLIVMFLCTDLMFQAAGIAFIAFSRYWLNHSGETFTIVLITVAAAEAAMALALVVLLFRKKESLDAEEWTELQG